MNDDPHLDGDDVEIKGIGDWIGITKRKQKTAAEKLRAAKRLIERLVGINADLLEEIDRLKKENEHLKSARS